MVNQSSMCARTSKNMVGHTIVGANKPTQLYRLQELSLLKAHTGNGQDIELDQTNRSLNEVNKEGNNNHYYIQENP